MRMTKARKLCPDAFLLASRLYAVSGPWTYEGPALKVSKKELALWQAISDNPDDENQQPWADYSDWLDSQGHHQLAGQVRRNRWMLAISRARKAREAAHYWDQALQSGQG